MTQVQLVDSLTSSISLYHFHSQPSNSEYNPNSWSSILKCFSSLTVHQRAHLIAIDSKFAQTLIQMLRTRGHGFFIVLPDLLSYDLPSVCFRKSQTTFKLSESNQSERRNFDATRLFASREGESIEECSSSVENLDSVTVSEAFAENFDRLMEGGEESELGSD